MSYFWTEGDKREEERFYLIAAILLIFHLPNHWQQGKCKLFVLLPSLHRFFKSQAAVAELPSVVISVAPSKTLTSSLEIVRYKLLNSGEDLVL